MCGHCGVMLLKDCHILLHEEVQKVIPLQEEFWFCWVLYFSHPENSVQFLCDFQDLPAENSWQLQLSPKPHSEIQREIQCTEYSQYTTLRLQVLVFVF